MKRTLLSLAVVLAASAAAHAQIVITYTKQNKNSKLTVTYSGGYYSGYGGYGYGGGFGFSGGGFYGGGSYGGFAPGFIWSSGESSFAFGTNFLGQDWRGYPAGYGGYGTTYYGPGGYGTTYRIPTYIDYQRAYGPRTGAAAEVGQMNVEKTLDAGLAKFKAGDYAGAVAAFKRVVVADFNNATAKLWMGLALAGSGDMKNAEKAVKAAVGGLAKEQIARVDLKSAFKDAKEQARYQAAAEKAGGSLAEFVKERLK
jgi:hypothetical protein